MKWSDLETTGKQLQNMGKCLNTEESDDDDDESKDDDTEDTEAETESEDEDRGAYTKVIRIKHTENCHLDQLQRNLNVSRDKISLDNPGDIYRVFYQPKSILKTEKSFDSDASVKGVNFNFAENEQVDKETAKDEKVKFEPHKVIVKTFNRLFLAFFLNILSYGKKGIYRCYN